MYEDGSEAALSRMHWFTTRRSRALKRRLSGSDELLDARVDVVVLGAAGAAAVVVVEPAIEPVVEPVAVEFAGAVGEP
jgi:Asp/Glu/hydantoin racemase